MSSPSLRMAHDYNRALPLPIRWAHVGWAGFREHVGPLLMWWAAPVRRKWTMPLTLGVVLFVVLWPWDQWVAEQSPGWAAGLPSDIRREWEAWQQYGQGVSLVLVAVLIALLDPSRWRRLLDLGAAAVVGFVVYQTMKMGIGRPRPGTGPLDAESFPGPWGVYPVMKDGRERLVSGWDGYSEVWSMPSSHAVAAVLLSVFLVRMYPRLKWPMTVLAGITVTGRVLFGAHWATDVAVGACLGYAIGACATDGYWGVRAVDWVWGKTVGHSAERPRGMWPVVVEAERCRGVV